jgi:hypothetical protein
MPAYITRQDKPGRGEQWVLNIGDSVTTLIKPDGQPLLEWTPAQVEQGVEFPSFSKSIKYVGFNVAAQGMLQFAVDAATVKALRGFANRGIASRGPEAVRSVLHKAIATSLVGAAVLCAGIVFLAITIHEIATDKSDTNGSPHRVGFITAIVGFAILCRGIYGFYHYSQLKQLAGSQSTTV